MKKKIFLVTPFLLVVLALVSFSVAGLADPQIGASNQIYLPIVSKVIKYLWIGPDGGSIVGLAVSPSNPDIMYAGTWGAGVFRTSNGGTSWKPVNAGLPGLLINAIEVDPKNPNVAYAGPYRQKLYKTVDGGASWFTVSNGIQEGAIVYAIAIDPVQTNRLYVSTRGISNDNAPPWNGVVYKSENGGSSWDDILADVGGAWDQDWAYDIDIHPKATNMVFVTMHNRGGVFFSDDYGVSFNARNEGMTDLSGRALAIDPRQADPSTLYFGTWYEVGTQKSMDTGLTWEPKNSGSYLAKVYRMIINPLDPTMLYLATWNNYGVLKTINGGESWTSKGLTLNQIYTVAFNPVQPNILFAGTNGDGLYRSTTNGDSWAHRQAGITNTSVNTILVQPNLDRSVYISIKDGGISRKLTETGAWQDYNRYLPEKDIHALVRNPGNMNLLYALTDHSGLYRTNLTNTTAGWVKFGNGLPSAVAGDFYYSPDHPFADREDLEAEVELYPGTMLDPGFQPEALLDDTVPLLAMTFAPSDPNIAYMGLASHDTPYSAVYTSYDGGLNWFDNAPSYWSLKGRTAWGIAVNPDYRFELYVTTSSPADVFHSTDAGKTWEIIRLPGEVWGVYAVVIPPTDSNRVYVGTTHGVFVRENDGPWTQTGLKNISTAVLVAHPEKANVLLAGTTAGAYITKNYGATWAQVDPLLANTTIQSIAFDPLDPRFIFFGTKTSGAVRIYLP